MASKDFVRIGEIAKPHGVKGELSVIYHADSPLLLDHAPRVWLAPATGGRPRPHTVRHWRTHHGRVLLTLQEVADRNAAEALRGMDLLLRAQDLPEPDPDEIYLHQLEGCRVELPDGSLLGTLRHVLAPTPEQEVWAIETPDGREVLFPAHEDAVLLADPEAGLLRIDPPPGLLELYLGEPG
jgi:16S rRNA processing protein RimM